MDMKAYIGNVHCGACGQLLIVDMRKGPVPGILFCVQSDCEQYEKRYYAPTVELKEVRK